jgi:hypothetical protein
MSDHVMDSPPVQVGRFSVEPQEFWTECECPEALCCHLPDMMRPYYGWIVWDNERGEHAWITHPGQFIDQYQRKRDAVEAAKAAAEGQQ